MTYAATPDDDGPDSPEEEDPPEAEGGVSIPALAFPAPTPAAHPHPAPEPAPAAHTGDAAESPPAWVLPMVSQLVDALRPPTLVREPSEPPPAPEPRYPNVQDWVTDWLAPMTVRRHGPDFHWCPQWWQHAEAISRLTGLWQAWEAAYADSDIAMLTWYQAYLDHHLPVLTSRDGPFLHCSNDQGHNRSAGVVLQTVAPPPGFWGTIDAENGD